MSFLWHDYETFGTHPAYDRPAQFAAIRTDDELEENGEPISLFCKPPRDALPHPYACLVTGITPQMAEQEGVIERDFALQIHDEMMAPGTCAVGYNNFTFDDEVSRHLFYRNFLDVYGREYKNGNSRFDLINLTRMCYALRPEGIEWPLHESGRPSFRLEDLTAANGIEHEGAHDALVDVRATIALARLLRDRQPKLWGWALGLRNRDRVRKLLDSRHPRPLVHSSGRISASRGCTTLILPLTELPERRNEVVVYDLAEDPEPLLELDAGQISDRVFSSAADLPPGEKRIPLKTVRVNRAPMLAPLGVLKGVDGERIDLDPETCQRRAERILPRLEQLRSKLIQVFQRPWAEAQGDPDGMLYSGGFFPPADQRKINRIHSADPETLRDTDWRFEDPRLPELLFRYRARNFPDSLTAEEWARWETARCERLRKPLSDGPLDAEQFFAELAEARSSASRDGAKLAILDAVEAWGRELLQEP